MLLSAGIDAHVGHFEDTVIGEQIARVVPHLPIGVVAVGVLQIGDLVLVVHRLDAPVERGERGCGVPLIAGIGIPAGIGGIGLPASAGRVVERNDLDVAIQQ